MSHVVSRSAGWWPPSNFYRKPKRHEQGRRKSTQKRRFENIPNLHHADYSRHAQQTHTEQHAGSTRSEPVVTFPLISLVRAHLYFNPTDLTKPKYSRRRGQSLCVSKLNETFQRRARSLPSGRVRVFMSL